MKIGSMNNPALPVVNEVKLFGEMNLDFIELTVEYPKATPSQIAKHKNEIVNLTSSYSMTIITHTPWFFHLAHPYESVSKAFIKESVKVLELTHILNASKLTVHVEPTEGVPSLYYRDLRWRMMRKFREGIAELVKNSRKYGVTVCIENLDDKSMTLKEFKELFEDIDELWFTLDAGHAYINRNNMEYIDQIIKILKHKIKHIHVHDNMGREDLHLPIGAGRIDWGKFFNSISKIGYNDTLTLEIHTVDRDYIKISRDKVLKLLNINSNKH
jgi:sugar phosphate isomerase/epimerase